MLWLLLSCDGLPLRQANGCRSAAVVPRRTSSPKRGVSREDQQPFMLDMPATASTACSALRRLSFCLPTCPPALVAWNTTLLCDAAERFPRGYRKPSWSRPRGWAPYLPPSLSFLSPDVVPATAKAVPEGSFVRSDNHSSWLRSFPCTTRSLLELCWKRYVSPAPQPLES